VQILVISSFCFHQVMGPGIVKELTLETKN